MFSLLWNFSRRLRRSPPLEERIHFTQLKHRSDDEWRAALAESPTKAARWVYAAATYGNIDAQLFWAQMLLDGYGTSHDPEGAFRWFKIAAESKRADALNMLGRCHELGWGVPVDFEKAADFYRDAAEKSYDWAQFNLACLMLDGKGVTRDPEAAFDLFVKAAEQGHVKSFHMVGRCCEHGWGRSCDMAAAEEWYRRGAEGGEFRAQYRYGFILLERDELQPALSLLRAVAESAPAGFCRDIAGELTGHSNPLLREIGLRARERSA